MPTYTTPSPVDARIDLPLSDIRVIASDRDTTVVDVVGDDDAIRCVFSRNQLTLSTTADRGGVVGWGLGMLGLGPSSGATVTVEVPTGSDLHATARHGSLSTQGSLGTCQVHTEHGGVHLDEVGPVEIRSRHSEISVEHATADLEITTSSGDVRVGVIAGSASITNNDSDILVNDPHGPRQLRGSHGDMTIERLYADLLARNAYGNVRVTEVVAGTCDIATTYGEVEIGIAEGTAAWLDVRSDAGTVRNRLDQQPGPDAFDHAAEVRAQTRDGDILIRRGRPAQPRPHRFWKH
jgi:DUF4097 and DUF4098 domain-containing protein YvlB